MFDEWRGLRLYTDASGDDEGGYLEPVVRFARWDRENDIRLLPSWPSMAIDLGALPIDSPQLQALVRRLQEGMAQVPFAPHGLPVRRNFGTPPEVARGYLTIRAISGWQDRELSVHVGEAPALYETFLVVEAELRRMAISMDRREWLERYECSPSELLARKGWYWDGQTPSI